MSNANNQAVPGAKSQRQALAIRSECINMAICSKILLWAPKQCLQIQHISSPCHFWWAQDLGTSPVEPQSKLLWVCLYSPRGPVDLKLRAPSRCQFEERRPVLYSFRLLRKPDTWLRLSCQYSLGKGCNADPAKHATAQNP